MGREEVGQRAERQADMPCWLEPVLKDRHAGTRNAAWTQQRERYSTCIMPFYRPYSIPPVAGAENSLKLLEGCRESEIIKSIPKGNSNLSRHKHQVRVSDIMEAECEPEQLFLG